MKRPITYAISQGLSNDLNFEETSKNIVEHAKKLSDIGVSYFQIREKSLSSSNLYKLSVDAVNALRNTEMRLLINDRADIAAAVGAYGVHLAGSSIPAHLVKRAFGSSLSIFVSTHSIDDVYQAIEHKADAAVFGPIFSTPGKSEPVGMHVLRSVVDSAGEFPIVALGGIDGSNCRSAVEVGAAGVAGIRCFADLGSARKLTDVLGDNE
ncbi:MAG: thiamine phosphate synthase [Blastocatellia bacterium]|nr:thiamine phosphate synthase [Blastocatellia bacterium]